MGAFLLPGRPLINLVWRAQCGLGILDVRRMYTSGASALPPCHTRF